MCSRGRVALEIQPAWKKSFQQHLPPLSERSGNTRLKMCFEKKGHWHQVWYEIKENAHFSKYMIFNCNEIKSENV